MSRFAGAMGNTTANILRMDPVCDIQKNIYEPYPPRPDIVWAGLWPSSRMMAGDCSSGEYMLGEDASNTSGAYEFPYRMLVHSSGHGGFFLCGITRDASGNPLANVMVQGFLSGSDLFQSECISSFSGEYCWVGQFQQAHYLVAYLPGAPDVAGTTVNTLIPTTTRTY